MNNKQNRLIISDKPYSVPIEMRPLWRIGLIVISIYVVSGNKKYLDIKKLNILVWMLIRSERWSEYSSYLNGERVKTPLVSVDTSTYKATEYAIAKKLVKLDEGRLHLTKTGDNLYSLFKENDVMKEEIEFLVYYGKLLTEEKVKGLTG